MAAKASRSAKAAKKAKSAKASVAKAGAKRAASGATKNVGKTAEKKTGPIGSLKKLLGGIRGKTTKTGEKVMALQAKPGKGKAAADARTKASPKSSKGKLLVTTTETIEVAESRITIATTRTARASAAAVSGPPVCREVACELVATTGSYCRMHYIKNWKKIKRKELILKEKKLNNYVEELVSKYPDKYIEAIRQDLASEKDFSKVIADLEIDEGTDEFEGVETESAEGIIDNIKRDFEDDGDVF